MRSHENKWNKSEKVCINRYYTEKTPLEIIRLMKTKSPPSEFLIKIPTLMPEEIRDLVLATTKSSVLVYKIRWWETQF